MISLRTLVTTTPTSIKLILDIIHISFLAIIEMIRVEAVSQHVPTDHTGLGT